MGFLKDSNKVAVSKHLMQNLRDLRVPSLPGFSSSPDLFALAFFTGSISISDSLAKVFSIYVSLCFPSSLNPWVLLR